MPIASIEAYLKRLDARMAEMKLVMADAISLPHMKKNDQTRTVKQWEKTASAQSKPASKPASPAVLRLMGIGVEIRNVDKSKPG